MVQAIIALIIAIGGVNGTSQLTVEEQAYFSSDCGCEQYTDKGSDKYNQCVAECEAEFKERLDGGIVIDELGAD